MDLFMQKYFLNLDACNWVTIDSHDNSGLDQVGNCL